MNIFLNIGYQRDVKAEFLMEFESSFNIVLARECTPIS
jgi:hypothetical protein